MALFDQIGEGGSKKKKWIMIGIGTALIAIFLVIRNSMRQSAAPVDTTPITPQITDTGGYPSDSFGGGISGTGMDQTLATYLAIADQNSTMQMSAVSDQLKLVQSQMNTQNTALKDQIAAMNTKATAGNIGTAPTPATTSTPATTAHPDPHKITLIHYGTYHTPKGGWNLKNSVVDVLKKNQAKADPTSLNTYAKEAGISNYKHTAAQNIQLKNALAKQGIK